MSQIGPSRFAEPYAAARRRMVEEIEAEVRLTADLHGKAELDPRVIEALVRVPRHEFVPVEQRAFAYENRPLGIGRGQTISQPFMVAVMSDLLGVGERDVALEVGTGSGYQAAVLSRLVRRLYSIETLPELASAAALRLARLGFTNVEVRTGDGAAGWPEHAPFDGIMVTAAAREVPAALVEQLAPGGRLLMPVGGRREQTLELVEKGADGAVTRRGLLPVAFVPLIAPGS